MNTYENTINFEATELRLGLPGTEKIEKKCSKRRAEEEISPPSKTQIVGWPPVRSYRKNALDLNKNSDENNGVYVKVSMDGAAYLRKVDLSTYNTYEELLEALENMFRCNIGVYSEREGYNGSEFTPTYEDKDGDWMLVGDVPWDMFIKSCKKLRIIRGNL